MKLLHKIELCLGLETFDELGFDSEEQLNMALVKLISERSQFKKEIVPSINKK